MIDESGVEVITLDAAKPPLELAQEAAEWVEHKIYEKLIL